MASGPIISWQIDEKNNGNSDRLLFSWTSKPWQMETEAMKLNDTYFLEENL